MATGSDQFPVMHVVDGFRLGTASAGIKTAGRKDLVVMEIAEGSRVAGVFTKNAFCAAPVTVCKEHLVEKTPRFLLVNTGNANAGTGEQGMQDALQSCFELASVCQVEASQVLPFSTGVIGENLPMERLLPAIPDAVQALSIDGWVDAAQGILTTDTRPKGASRQFEIDGKAVTITGVSKGSGMIKPNMATMLAFVATDAEISSELLQPLITKVTNQSFNRITVDSDTSTNDSTILVATGKSGVTISQDNLSVFTAQLQAVFVELAQAIIRDGEGAGKFVTVVVDGAKEQAEALDAAFTIAESPLVKTALAASDPNWGRILAAIGRANIDQLDVSKVEIRLNDVLIVEQGCRAASYTEEAGQAAMQKEDIEIYVALNRGTERETVWTTDLTYEYIRINAEYRT